MGTIEEDGVVNIWCAFPDGAGKYSILKRRDTSKEQGPYWKAHLDYLKDYTLAEALLIVDMLNKKEE